MSAGTRITTVRAPALATLGFALLLAAALLSALAPLARGLSQARPGARSFFFCFASGTSSQPDAFPGRSDQKHDRGQACAFCAACAGGDAPLAARSGPVDAAPVQGFSLAWTVADCAAPTLRRKLSNLPRAPPSVFG